MRYFIILRRTSTGYSADAPDVPGCISTGANVEHTKQMMTEALEGHLEVMIENGEPIPSPSTHIDFSIDNDSAEEFCTWVEVLEPRLVEMK